LELNPEKMGLSAGSIENPVSDYQKILLDLMLKFE
jgi:hypothetical protein